MGVYERRKYPFLTPELRFLRAFLRRGRPALGVCLGSQLLAAALGATVYKNKNKEIGWYPLSLTPAGSRDPLLRVLGKTGTVFQWHGDTFTRPAGTAHLARSPLCRHQAFRFRRNVYGLQFHLEVDGAMVRQWMAQPGASAEVAAVGPEALERLKNGIPRHAAEMVRRGRAFFDGWCGLIPVD
jgi:GMP synthase (glutamine-hydrolysing)